MSTSTSDRRKASKSKSKSHDGRRSSKRSSTEPAPLTREQKELLRQRLLDEELLDAVTQTQAALGEMLLRAGSSGDAGASLSLTAATSTSATAATASQWELQLRLAEEKIAALAAEKKQLEQRVKTQQKDFDGQHRAKWRLIQELEAKNTELDRLVVQLSSSSSQSQSQSQSQHQQQVLQQSVAGHQRDVSPSSPGDDRSDDQHTLNGSRDELSHLLFSPPPPQPPQPQQQQQRRPSSVTSSGTATVARPKSTQSFAQQTSFHSLQQQQQTTTTATSIFTVVSKEGSSLVHGLPDVNISFQSRSMAASAAAVAAEYDYLSPSTSTSQALYIINQLVHNNNDLVERNATLERDKKRLDVALTDKDQQLRQRLLELQEKDAAVAKMKQLLTQANATITATVEDYRVLQEQVATLTAKLKEQSLENTHLKALLSPQKQAAAPRAPSPTWSTVFGHTSPRASPSSSPSPSPGSFLANSSVHGAAARSGYYHGSGPSAGRAPAAYLLSQSLQESLSSPPPYTRDSRQTAASLLAAAASSSTTLSTSATTAALSKPTVTLRQDVEARLQEL
eukprot:gene2698-1959_t